MSAWLSILSSNPMPAAQFGHDNSALLCLVTGARLQEARVLGFAFATFTFITSARRLMGGSRFRFSPVLTAFFALIGVHAPPRTSTLFFILARGARSTRLRGSVVGGGYFHPPHCSLPLAQRDGALQALAGSRYSVFFFSAAWSSRHFGII
jgi:hypothetical protein